jgi:predicted DNA-binding transcriptional regulator YafY
MAKPVGRRGGGRTEQLTRVLQLLTDLSTLGGCDLYTLAERHGTSTRTIRRDLEAIAGVGIPLKQLPGEGSRLRWSLDLQHARAREIATIVASLSDRSGTR